MTVTTCWNEDGGKCVMETKASVHRGYGKGGPTTFAPTLVGNKIAVDVEKLSHRGEMIGLEHVKARADSAPPKTSAPKATPTPVKEEEPKA